MRVALPEIPEHGLTFPVRLTDAWAKAAAHAAIDADPTALEGEVRLTVEADRVHVTGRIAATAPHTCDRCGEDTLLAIAADVDLVYVPFEEEEEAADEADDEVDDDEDGQSDHDLEVGYYEGGHLELTDVLCEAISLAMPPRISCPDVAACDERTAQLLATKGASGVPGHPAFARLKNLG